MRLVIAASQSVSLSAPNNYPNPNYDLGFTYSNGSYQTFDLPAGLPAKVGTNAAGTMVGYFQNTTYASPNTFIGTPGNFIALNLPANWNVIPNAINDLGEVVGSYIDQGGNQHGFVIYPNGTFQTLDFPGASEYEFVRHQ